MAEDIKPSPLTIETPADRNIIYVDGLYAVVTPSHGVLIGFMDVPEFDKTSMKVVSIRRKLLFEVRVPRNMFDTIPGVVQIQIDSLKGAFPAKPKEKVDEPILPAYG